MPQFAPAQTGLLIKGEFSSFDKNELFRFLDYAPKPEAITSNSAFSSMVSLKIVTPCCELYDA